MKVSLSYCDITQCRAHLASLTTVLSSEEREHAKRYHRESDRDRFCAGRVLIRHELASITGCPAGEIRIQTEGQGKPFVSGGPSFNLSHSHSIVLLGVASGCDIGVDVEHVRNMSDLKRLARSCFSAYELSEFQRFSGDAAVGAFFRAWTRKEALVKALGSGLYLDLKTFSVSLDASVHNALLECPGSHETKAQWTVVPVCLPGDYEAAVAANAPSIEIDVRKVSFESNIQ